MRTTSHKEGRKIKSVSQLNCRCSTPIYNITCPLLCDKRCIRLTQRDWNEPFINKENQLIKRWSARVQISNKAWKTALPLTE